ncbi:hypothetical protein V6N12_038771 [Hibiscus sabdariffa]|uniref:Uncharacterized protein n=1 Tax=Hibiscus sabdariffa TaxID=183260 RepID=A0ABR2CAS7_9ROSI
MQPIVTFKQQSQHADLELNLQFLTRNRCRWSSWCRSFSVAFVSCRERSRELAAALHSSYSLSSYLDSSFSRFGQITYS